MNIAGKILLVIALITVLSSCKKNSFELCETGSCTIAIPADTYNYPIKPGMPIWATFKTGAEMLAALQVPADTLAKISTEGLIQTCADFPLLGDLLLNIGVNVAGALTLKMQTFSGMIELCKRPDAGIKMKERYKKMYPDCINSLTTYDEKAEFVANFTAYEMIMSYDSIIAKLTLNEKKELVKLALLKYNCKRSQRNNFAYYDFATTLYIPTKIMVQENFMPFTIQVPNMPGLKLYVDNLLFEMSYDKVEAMYGFIYKKAQEFIK